MKTLKVLLFIVFAVLGQKLSAQGLGIRNSTWLTVGNAKFEYAGSCSGTANVAFSPFGNYAGVAPCLPPNLTSVTLTFFDPCTSTQHVIVLYPSSPVVLFTACPTGTTTFSMMITGNTIEVFIT